MSADEGVPDILEKVGDNTETVPRPIPPQGEPPPDPGA